MIPARRVREHPLYDMAPVACVATDPDDVVLQANPACRRLLGSTRARVIGRTLASLVVPGNRAEYAAHRERAARERGVASCDVLMRLGRRPPVDVHLQTVSMQGRGGRVMFITAVIDVSRLRGMEQLVLRRNPDLGHLLRIDTVGRMACMLAHELAQPLATIVSLAESCVRERVASAGQDPDMLLHRIEAEASRAGELVRWLRSFVRPAPGKRVTLDANEVVRQVVALTMPLARERRTPLRALLAPRKLLVSVDAIQVQQIVLNMVRNGIDASGATRRAGGVEVRTGTQRRGWVAIEVHDRGERPQGVTYEDLFRSFYTTKPGGLGLGLTISRVIAEQHGGRITGKPRPGGGSTFRLTLPASVTGITDGAPRRTA